MLLKMSIAVAMGSDERRKSGLTKMYIGRQRRRQVQSADKGIAHDFSSRSCVLNITSLAKAPLIPLTYQKIKLHNMIWQHNMLS